MSTRQLLLHASALNEDEYDTYTSSLRDLIWTDEGAEESQKDDPYYENLQIGVRELRGWLRGRYGQVSPANLDAILKFFSPTLSPNHTLSGGQVFAVLRLVVHVQSGREVDRGLAFVQAHPTSSKQLIRMPALDSKPSTNPFVSRSKHNPFSPTNIPDSLLFHTPLVSPTKVPPLPPRKPWSTPSLVPSQPPLPPPRHNSTLLPNATHSKSPSPSRPSSTAVSSGGPPPIPAKPTHVTSALMKQSLQASRAAQAIKKAEEQLEQERVLQVLKSSSVVSGTNIKSTNPSSSILTPAERGRLAYPKADRQPSTSGSSYHTGAMSDTSNRERERSPPALPKRRNTLHNHQRQRQNPSPPASITSLQQVALAAAPPFPGPPRPSPFSPAVTRTRSPETSPSRRPPPPTHPDRKPPPLAPQFPPIPDSRSSPFTDNRNPPLEAETSPTARVFRSKSLHHPSPHSNPPPVPPPLRKKKRPESMQVLSPTYIGGPFSDEPSASTSRDVFPPASPFPRGTQPPQHPGHQRASHSLSVPTSAKSTPSTISEGSDDEDAHRQMARGGGGGGTSATARGTLGRNGETHNLAASFQRTLSTLHPKLEAQLDALQPRLEKAKYKAEAGLNVRRGYVSVDSGIGGLARKGSWAKRREEKEELLAGDTDDRGLGHDESRYDPPSVDESGDGDSDEEGARKRWAREATDRWGGRKRDELKWPVRDSQPLAEGWTRMK